MVGLVCLAAALAVALSVFRSGRSANEATEVLRHSGASTEAERRLDLTHELEEGLAALREAGNAQDARQILADLRAYLDILPADLAADVIAGFLGDPFRDAATGIPFAVGEGGSLEGYPSLRVALLDWLLESDAARAGEVAEEILAAPTHPDEWAVALRNYARAVPDVGSREFLRRKTEELIRNPDWRAEPSIGYLHAFDVLVHTRATQSSPLLAELAADTSEEGRARAHASFLTLDRLTIREPVAMMRQLAARPELIKARDRMVANMFARADLRSAEQRELVRDYLLDPSRTNQELEAFAGVYPNANLMISNNLLTRTPRRSGEELRAHDAAVLPIVEEWLEAPDFAPVRKHLETMHERLRTFVK